MQRQCGWHPPLPAGVPGEIPPRQHCREAGLPVGADLSCPSNAWLPAEPQLPLHHSPARAWPWAHWSGPRHCLTRWHPSHVLDLPHHCGPAWWPSQSLIVTLICWLAFLAWPWPSPWTCLMWWALSWLWLPSLAMPYSPCSGVWDSCVACKSLGSKISAPSSSPLGSSQPILHGDG